MSRKEICYPQRYILLKKREEKIIKGNFDFKKYMYYSMCRIGKSKRKWKKGGRKKRKR